MLLIEICIKIVGLEGTRPKGLFKVLKQHIIFIIYASSKVY
jgi:hypothetical protein